MEIRFSIPGQPKGKDRPRVRKDGWTYTPKETVQYENLVRMNYKQRLGDFKFEDSDMLDMRIKAYFQIPKSKTKRLKMLMEGNILRPIVKPDSDNIIKIIADSLNRVAYKDDTQVVDVQCRKFYSNNPRVEVLIRKI